MRRLYLIFFLIVASNIAFATHQIGLDIRYEYTGTGNVYRVYLNMYADCGGANAPLNSNTYIVFRSPSTNQNFGRLFLLSSIDTIKSMWCPSTATSCGGAYAPFLVGHFIDTVTLSQCADWTISCQEGPRSGNIQNLGTGGGSGSGYSIYVEAFLNNLTAPNSSPIIDGDPQLYVGAGSMVTVPFNVTELDGDSVGGVMRQPYTGLGSAIPYYTSGGFSLANPFGASSYTQLSIANKNLKLYATSVGRYAIAARVSDYRNGVLVGYSSRDWAQAITSTGNPKAPVPLSSANLTTITCPGQANTYTINFMDSVSTDSVYLTFVPPNNGITYTTSYSPGIASASATISWTTPSTYNPATNPNFIIKVNARDNQCPMNGYATYNILVHATYCSTDTVWAGDANADKVVNMYDPLYVALAYGSTGPTRPGASMVWAPQWCAAWTNNFNTGINYKHADCDGNGTVNSTDLSAITANYGQSHPKELYQQLAKEAGVPDLYFDHSGLNIYPGATISIPIKLGSTASTATMLGLASRIKISGVAPTNVSISYPATSWLGTSANTVRFSKSTTSNSIDWAYARTDHQNVTGQGTLATLNFTIPQGSAGQKIVLTLENTKMINGTGGDITSYNVLSDTMSIWPLSIGSTTASSINNAVVIPNPSHNNAVLQMSLDKAAELNIAVTDIRGRIVWQSNGTYSNGTREVLLPATISTGIYIVTVKSSTDTRVIKWIKE